MYNLNHFYFVQYLIENNSLVLLSIHYFIRSDYFAINDVVYNIKTPFIQTDFSWDNFYGKEWLSIMHQSCSYFTFRFNLFFADWIKHKRHFVINSFSFWKLIYVNRIRSNVICTYMIIEDLIWSIYMILFSMNLLFQVMRLQTIFWKLWITCYILHFKSLQENEYILFPYKILSRV